MNALDTDDLLNPFSNTFLLDPYPHYARWRRGDGLCRGVSPDSSGAPCLYALGYAYARQLLADDRLGLEFYRVVPPEHLPRPAPEALPFLSLVQQWMLFRDPPHHARLRKVFAHAFARAGLSRYVPAIGSITNALLEEVADALRVNLIDALACSLPVLVIARILGLPEEDFPLLKRWSRALLRGIDMRRADESDDALREASDAATQIQEYLSELLARRRRAPDTDLISEIAGSTELTREELIANCALLLFAGHETTVNLIGNGSLALLKHPEQLAALRADPSRLGTAIEELLRYDSPSQITFRYAMEPIELGEYRMQPGEPIGIVIGSANRDETQFEQPDTLDLARAPNRHLSFGSGRHACLGSALARLEAEAAFRGMLRMFARIELTGPPRWRPSFGLRGLLSLPVEVEPAWVPAS